MTSNFGKREDVLHILRSYDQKSNSSTVNSFFSSTFSTSKFFSITTTTPSLNASSHLRKSNQLTDSTHPNHELIQVLKELPELMERKVIRLPEVICDVTRLLTLNDVVIKKEISDVICFVSNTLRIDDLALLSLNIFILDLEDANPDVRVNALNTIVSVPVLAEHKAIDAIESFMKDRNPVVRKSGVVACGKLFEHSSHLIESHGIVDLLYTRILQDVDSFVITFALQTLNYILLSNKNGIILNINEEMARHLMKNVLIDARKNVVRSIEKVFIMDYMEKHFNMDEHGVDFKNELLKVLNEICFDDDENGHLIFLATFRLFVKTAVLTETFDKILTSFLKKNKQNVKKLFDDERKDVEPLKLSMLEFVLSMKSSKILFDVFQDWRPIFEVKHATDCDKLCIEKLKLLSSLTSPTSEIEVSTSFESLLSVMKREHIFQVEEKDLCDSLIDFLASKCLDSRVDEYIQRLHGQFCTPSVKMSKTNISILKGVVNQLPSFSQIYNSHPSPRIHVFLCDAVYTFISLMGEAKSLPSHYFHNIFHFIVTCDNLRVCENIVYILEFMNEQILREKITTLYEETLFCNVKVFSAHPVAFRHVLVRFFEFVESESIMTEHVKFYKYALSNCDLVKNFADLYSL